MYDKIRIANPIGNVACVIPFPQKGGGGIRTIFNNLTALKAQCGCCVDLYLIPSVGMETDTEKLKSHIAQWFHVEFDNFYAEASLLKEYDLAIATSWDSVSLVVESNAKCKCYFIQDYEPMFFPMGIESLTAEETYQKDCWHITFGRWLKSKIQQVSGKPSLSFDFCADKRIYRKLDCGKERAVCAIWQPEKPRRLSAFLLEAIHIITMLDPTIQIYLYGSEINADISFPQVHQLGLITTEACNELYNKCMCGISLSASNPSRIPFEMMSAGLPVVELYRENNLYDFPEEAVLLAANTPEAFADAVCKIVDNPALQERMSLAGMEFMKDRPIEKETAEFIRCIYQCVDGAVENAADAPVLYRRPPEMAKEKSTAISISNREKRRELILNEARLLSEQERALAAPIIMLQCELPASERLSLFDRASVAIWSSDDQSDLIWLDLAKNNGRILSGEWENPTAPDEEKTYQFHLYKRSRFKRQGTCIAVWSTRIVGGNDKTKPEKNYTCGGIQISLSSEKKPLPAAYASEYSEWELAKAIRNNKRSNSLRTADFVLLDTAMDSENLGDFVIMDACNSICTEMMPDKEFKHVSTHQYRSEMESLHRKIKILCGTNILYQKMEDQQQWMLPKDLTSYDQVCLLGVGMNDIMIDQSATPYTKKLMKALLKPDVYHSVRDSKAERKLREMGFENVINTACPTMWQLTPEHVAAVPKEKGRCVLTSVTDYNVDLENDKYLLELLREEYEEVYIWPQGTRDVEFVLSKVIDLNEYHIIEPKIENLNAILSRKDMDYIGTRLHAGIRALSMGRRTLVITVDDRARQIGIDTGFPTMERTELKEKLRTWINTPTNYQITLPWENIQKWKEQFVQGSAESISKI